LIPFLDLAADFAEVEAEARRRLDGVLARQQFVLGPETGELEATMRSRTGATAAVAVSSGSDALSLALLALGVGAGDAVLLPSFTFFATAGAVARAGAVPVFCDIEASTFLAEAAQMEAAIERDFQEEGGVVRHRASGARLKALLPVHLYGRACAMDSIVSLAGRIGAVVVEDAAQAVGCRIGGEAVGTPLDGRHVGLWGDVGCFSFYPTKNLGGAGDGGLLLCRDADLGARLASLRTHGGVHGSYEHREIGVNARMGEMEAAVLNAKLARLDAWTARRVELAALYDECLVSAASRGILTPAPPAPEGAHVHHQYVVRIARGRDEVMARLEGEGIATRVFYPLPLHLQPCFRSLGGREGDLPLSEAAAREVLCLPLYPSLTDGGVERVAAALEAAVERASR
jgi:dTDP-4-amino-4,6-dideoxygalactose transaminase